MALLLGGLGVREVIRQNSRPREGHYVEALGGWVNYPVALDAAAALTEGEEVFSLYATGLELVKGSFQPSGYDYVIHALGGEARAAYLASFEQGRYPWAQTTALELERWLCVENWDIYRRIAANYERSMRTEYSWLWRRAADQHLDPEALDVAVATKMEDGRLEIEITAEPGANFTADICVSYTTGFSSAGGAVLSLGRRCVAAALPDPVGDGDTVWGYFAAENEALRLPIAVRNGHGTATLVPCDPNQVWLAYSRVALEGVLPDLRAPDWEIGRIA